MLNQNLTWCSFEPFPHILSLDPRKKTSAPPSPPPQKAMENSEVTCHLHFLQTKPVQSPHPLFTGHSFQPFHQLYCPSLDTSEDLHIFLKLWSSELHIYSRWGSTSAEIGGIITCFGATGDAMFDAAQTGICPLGCLSFLLPPTETTVNHRCQIPSAQLVCSQSSPNSYLSVAFPILCAFRLAKFNPNYNFQLISLSRSPVSPLVPQGSQQHLPVWYHQQTCKSAFSPESRLLINTLNRTGCHC